MKNKIIGFFVFILIVAAICGGFYLYKSGSVNAKRNQCLADIDQKRESFKTTIENLANIDDTQKKNYEKQIDEKADAVKSEIGNEKIELQTIFKNIKAEIDDKFNNGTGRLNEIVDKATNDNNTVIKNKLKEECRQKAEKLKDELKNSKNITDEEKTKLNTQIDDALKTMNNEIQALDSSSLLSGYNIDEKLQTVKDAITKADIALSETLTEKQTETETQKQTDTVSQSTQNIQNSDKVQGSQTIQTGNGSITLDLEAGSKITIGSENGCRITVEPLEKDLKSGNSSSGIASNSGVTINDGNKTETETSANN